MQTRFITSRDGIKLRAGLWGAGTAARGLCVLLNGQTEFLEKYEEVAGELTARGFAVVSLDWRGQGGSDRLLSNPLKAHVHDFADYDADLSALFEKVVEPLAHRTPPLVLAHSMGAHILLRGLHTRPSLCRAAVMLAPLLRAQTRGYPAPLARALCRLENLCGRKAEWVWGMEARDPLKITFDNNFVTSDAARFARNSALVGAHRELRLAGPTWGWLEAAYRSMARETAYGFAEAITTPILMVTAGRDQIVDTAAARQFASRLPDCRYLEFADAEHEILMENDAIRARFWDAFDRFVSTAP